MIKALLTIDDIASKNTPAIVDYLNEKGIKALMFAWGRNVEYYHEQAEYALKNGMIVGNHSYSHPHFSEITLEEGLKEIEKCEEVLDELYKSAGVSRVYRPFRFPYGDKGGGNKDAFQSYLIENGFNKVDDRAIPYPFWKEKGLDKDIDTSWTFDFEEFCIRPGSGFTKENVMDKMNDPKPPYGAPLFEDGGVHILLLHAHDETEEMVPGYYRMFIDYLLEKGVEFVDPTFL
ncbi:MAG: polysaccharide deacetylase family protein [Eubacterium sp.]|nr:polysaccharide deacetylase family protein [Eubacterium sp.]